MMCTSSMELLAMGGRASGGGRSEKASGQHVSHISGMFAVMAVCREIARCENCDDD